MLKPTVITFLLTLCLLVLFTPIGRAQTHAPQGAVLNPSVIKSPWPTYHGGVARQASTMLRGPTSAEPDVDVSYFEDAAGINFGTSPWHILSDERYSNSPRARTVWGTSLKYLYKYEIDGNRFEYADSFQLNWLPFSIGWNFFALRDGRIVVPNPTGLQVPEHRETACAGHHPALLIFQDGDTSDSPITCVDKFEFTPEIIKDACGLTNTVIGTTAVGVDVLLDGHIAARLRSNVAKGFQRQIETWVAILDRDLTHIRACAKVGNGTSTNGVPMEPGPDGSTIFYIATEGELIAMQYRPVQNRVERISAVPVKYRSRTGTTPTLLTSGPFGWVLTVDGRCAVDNVFTGNIKCDAVDKGPSRLLAIPRPLGVGPTASIPLPDFIDTVENSPAVLGNDIVVTNYSGYTPDGRKDGTHYRATGVVKLSWHERSRRFRTDWVNREIQFSGVPTISATANLVYGSGTEPDGNTYFYGLRLHADSAGPAGAVVVRTLLGPSQDSFWRARDAIYDAGNNILINDYGSAIMAGGSSLIRIKD